MVFIVKFQYTYPISYNRKGVVIQISQKKSKDTHDHCISESKDYYVKSNTSMTSNRTLPMRGETSIILM